MYTGFTRSLATDPNSKFTPDKTLPTDTLTGWTNTEPAGLAKTSNGPRIRGSARRASASLHTEHK